MKKWTKYIWWGVMTVGLLLAWWLRLAKLGSVPAGMTVDEVSYGYIAYSLAQTGKDEHGVSWPLIFQAYGDQKLPGQVYSILPLVKIFGLNNTAVRLPSAIASCAMIILIYILVRKWKFSRKVAGVAALLWAMSPALFMLGRGAWESNIALMFYLMGLIGLSKLIHIDDSKETELRKWLWTGVYSVCMAADWYFYVAYRPVTLVLMILALMATFIKSWNLEAKRKYLLMALVAMIFFVSPLLLNKSNTARFAQLNTSNIEGVEMEIIEKRTFCEHQGQLPRWWCDVIYNKLTIQAKSLINEMVRTLGIDYLSLQADEDLPVHQITGFGQVNVVTYILALIGIIPVIQAMWKRCGKYNPPFAWGLAIMPLISMLPAVSVGVQKVRLSPIFPVIFLLAAWGLDYWAKLLSAQKLSVPKKWILYTIIIVLAGYSVYDWLDLMTTYFGYHYYKNDWQTLAYVPEIDKKLQELNPDEVYWHVDYPDVLMFYAYDTRLDPEIFQTQTTYFDTEETGWQHAESLENRYFQTDQSVKSLACAQEASMPGKLRVVVEQDGTLAKEIEQYIDDRREKQNELNNVYIEPRAWPIRTTNGAQLLAYIVDLDWYWGIWCQVGQ